MILPDWGQASGGLVSLRRIWDLVEGSLNIQLAAEVEKLAV
jgi:hypothetical protein